MEFEAVARWFGLGVLVAVPQVVTGGLSNHLWRMQTDRGAFAVKEMVINADHPDFVADVEVAYGIEARAHTAGVPMPTPVPDPTTGRALARIGDSLFRVHTWTDGTPTEPSTAADEAITLLAQIHTAGSPRRTSAPAEIWRATGWDEDLITLASRVGSGGPPRTIEVDSHRDLDPKNTLRRTSDHALIALDWDAAGPTSAVQEAVSVALDWSGADPGASAPTRRRQGARPVMLTDGGGLGGLVDGPARDHGVLDGGPTSSRPYATADGPLAIAWWGRPGQPEECLSASLPVLSFWFR